MSLLDFRIEVKYLKNWISSANTRAASKNWSAMQQDFDWLMDEIENGKKGKVAFAIGWFNCVDSFSQIIQLGKGDGAYPLVDETKKVYFPFLVPKSNKTPIRTKDLDSDYVQCIHDIKERFRGAQIKAAVKVNSEQLLFNWQLGRDLVLRKSEEKWGKGITA